MIEPERVNRPGDQPALAETITAAIRDALPTYIGRDRELAYVVEFVVGAVAPLLDAKDTEIVRLRSEFGYQFQKRQEQVAQEVEHRTFVDQLRTMLSQLDDGRPHGEADSEPQSTDDLLRDEILNAVHDGMCQCRGVGTGLTVRSMDAGLAADRLLSKVFAPLLAAKDAAIKRWKADAIRYGSERDELVDRVAELTRERDEHLHLLDSFIHPEDPCWFDHHGGCQAHGFLDLEEGEVCPHEKAKQLLAGRPVAQEAKEWTLDELSLSADGRARIDLEAAEADRVAQEAGEPPTFATGGMVRPCGQCSALPWRPHADGCPDLIEPEIDSDPPRRPRVWQQGDPEPEGVPYEAPMPRVVDRYGVTWVADERDDGYHGWRPVSHGFNGWWQTWRALTLDRSPLTEVLPDLPVDLGSTAVSGGLQDGPAEAPSGGDPDATS